jgi:hypothetical protein
MFLVWGICKFPVKRDENVESGAATDLPRPVYMNLRPMFGRGATKVNAH